MRNIDVNVNLRMVIHNGIETKDMIRYQAQSDILAVIEILINIELQTNAYPKSPENTK